MGVGWRRFKERLHQGTPVHGSSGLQPTSNARCSTMLQEATNFTSKLKRCEKAIRTITGGNAEAAATIKLVMSTPLPRRWEETAAAAGGASPPVQPIGGNGFNGEQLSRAFQEAGRKTETEVLAPLSRWQEVYTQLGARFRDLEAVRLEVDSRRRTVAELSHKADVMRVRLGKGGDAKKEAALQETIKKLQHKEGKLQVATQSFVETERLLHRDLSTLISDAAWLKHYAAAAIRLQGHALLSAAEAFGPLPAGSPPPASKLAATVGAPASPQAMKGGINGGATPAAVPTPMPASHSDFVPASHSSMEGSAVGAPAPLPAMRSSLGSSAGPGSVAQVPSGSFRSASASSLQPADYPATPAASGGTQPPPMARFPVTAVPVQEGEGEYPGAFKGPTV